VVSVIAKVDVDAGVKSKFGDLVMDAGISALRVLLLGQVMEKKAWCLRGKVQRCFGRC